MMNESTTKKLAENELAEFRLLSNKINQKIYEFGTLGVEKIDIDRLVSQYVEKDKRLREEWSGLQKMEKDFMDKIFKKYGDGELDIANGSFIPLTNKTG
jgi:hypothetical protein